MFAVAARSLAARLAGAVLDCPHFHVVFTTPHDLLPLWPYNKRAFAAALFAAASGALMELLGDQKYLGARVGLLAALHTWSQTLAEHVHLHAFVPQIPGRRMIQFF